ncbi:MAG TPA: ribosome biogenesis GTPase YlqF [Clostridiales bacterium]|nr:ribosome biogenesis GTPase YlqF [Clostridiales bacterium]
MNENKTNINWYPGHMAKTRKEIIEDLKLIDVVIELLDSRIPLSSRNPDITEITKNKDRIIVLNKSDLSDKKENDKWIKYFKENGLIAIECDSNSGRGINEVLRAIEKLKEKELQEYASKGRTGRKIRAMILGIPNVGKSSFINRVSKTNRLEVGNKPGVTKKKQWIRINEKIELLDTPGVLWPKFDNEKVALNLAYTGSIKDEILPQIEIAYQLLKYLLENYKSNISERYKLSIDYIDEILNQNQPENFNIYEIMQEIGKKRGAIVSGGQVDDEKVARIILDDFRSGKLGKITLERSDVK